MCNVCVSQKVSNVVSVRIKDDRLVYLAVASTIFLSCESPLVVVDIIDDTFYSPLELRSLSARFDAEYEVFASFVTWMYDP